MSGPIDISTRDKLIEATEWILENDLILCVAGRRAYATRVLEELRADEHAQLISDALSAA